MAFLDCSVAPATNRRNTKRGAGALGSTVAGALAAMDVLLLSRGQTDVESDQHALSVGKIADNPAQRRRQLAHQGGHGQDLVARRQLRLAQQIYHLDAVLALKVLIAELVQVGHRGHGFGSLPGHIEPQFPGFCEVLPGSHLAAVYNCHSSPALLQAERPTMSCRRERVMASRS